MNFYITLTPDNLKSYPLHSHEVYEIIYYLEGEGVLRTKEKDYPFKKGDLFIVPPFVGHGSVASEPYKNVCVHTEDALLSNTSIVRASDNEQKDLENLSKILSRAYFESLPQKNALTNTLYTAYREMVLKIISSNKTHVLDEIIAEFSDNIGNANYNPSSAFQNRGYSQDHLRVLFKKKYSLNPVQYFINLKMAYAKTLIDTYGDKLKTYQVAELCGYNDALYFSKTFKKVNGIYPREYLKQRVK